MPRPVLHIGMAKCASTWLHDNLAHQSQAFGDFVGFDGLAPLVDEAMVRASVYRHGALGPGSADELSRRFMQWRLKLSSTSYLAETGRALMLSNECLTGAYPLPARSGERGAFDAATMTAFQDAAADLLAETFPGATIVFLVREPDQWIRSMYNNLVTMGLSDRGPAFEARHGDILQSWYHLDRLLPLYEDRFGTANVHLIPVELARADRAAFDRKLAAAYGFPVRLPVTSRNRSLPTGALEQLRSLHHLIDTLSVPDGRWEHPSMVLKDAIWRFCFDVVMNDPDTHAVLAKRFGDSPTFFEPSQELLTSLRARNTRVEKAFRQAGLDWP